MQRIPSRPAIRRFEPSDLPAGLILQAISYPAFLHEDAEAFASRLRLSASYCFVAERDGAVIAYLLAHGWIRQSLPPVGSVLADTAGEVLFVHDLAVSVAGRGLNIGRPLVSHAFASAGRDGLLQAELIAVEKAAGYWRALGFAEEPVSPDLAVKIATYGPEARWMTRSISDFFPKHDENLAS